MTDRALDSIPFTPPHERRQSRRIKVLLPVQIEAEGERHIGRITELSRAGARIEVRAPLASGQAVIVRRGGIELHGQVVWVEAPAAGLWFPCAMDEGTFLQIRRTVVG